VTEEKKEKIFFRRTGVKSQALLFVDGVPYPISTEGLDDIQGESTQDSLSEEQIERLLSRTGRV